MEIGRLWSLTAAFAGGVASGLLAGVPARRVLQRWCHGCRKAGQQGLHYTSGSPGVVWRFSEADLMHDLVLVPR